MFAAFPARDRACGAWSVASRDDQAERPRAGAETGQSALGPTGSGTATATGSPIASRCGARTPTRDVRDTDGDGLSDSASSWKRGSDPLDPRRAPVRRLLFRPRRLRTPTPTPEPAPTPEVPAPEPEPNRRPNLNPRRNLNRSRNPNLSPNRSRNRSPSPNPNLNRSRNRIPNPTPRRRSTSAPPGRMATSAARAKPCKTLNRAYKLAKPGQIGRDGRRHLRRHRHRARLEQDLNRRRRLSAGSRGHGDDLAAAAHQRSSPRAARPALHEQALDRSERGRRDDPQRDPEELRPLFQTGRSRRATSPSSAAASGPSVDENSRIASNGHLDLRLAARHPDRRRRLPRLHRSARAPKRTSSACRFGRSTA